MEFVRYTIREGHVRESRRRHQIRGVSDPNTRSRNVVIGQTPPRRKIGRVFFLWRDHGDMAKTAGTG